MKLAIIGATGFVGRVAVNEALAGGHEVTAIARHTKDLPTNSHLHIALGDVTDIDWLAQTLKGVDAVISAFNPGWTDPDLYANFVKGSNAILKAVEKSGVKRFLVVGGAQGARELRDALRAGSSLDWTVLSPAAMLAPGQRTGNFRLGTTSLLMNGDAPANISVEDLAVAILNEIEQPQFIKQQFTAAY